MIKAVDVVNVLSAKIRIEFPKLIRRARITLNIHVDSKIDRENSRRQIETQIATLAPKRNGSFR